MKLVIRRAGSRPLYLWLPNALVFNSIALRIYQHLPRDAPSEDWLQKIPPDAVKALCRELRRHKRLCLVDAQDAEGNTVKIIL